MMIVPLFIGVILNTFFPAFLNIGGLTTSLAKGSGALIAAFLLCMGAGINFRSTAIGVEEGCRSNANEIFSGSTAGYCCGKIFWR